VSSRVVTGANSSAGRAFDRAAGRAALLVELLIETVACRSWG
jgi:hypothetical protein